MKDFKISFKQITLSDPPDSFEEELEKVIDQYDDRYNHDLDQEDLDVNFFELFDSIIQSKTGSSDIKKVEEIGRSIKPAIKHFKNKYKVPRPSDLAKSLGVSWSGDDKAMGTVKSYSYPSGHTAQAYFLAYCLSDFYPNLKGRFLRLANKVAQSRIDRGVHFPSDLKSGIELAKKAYDQINKIKVSRHLKIRGFYKQAVQFRPPPAILDQVRKAFSTAYAETSIISNNYKIKKLIKEKALIQEYVDRVKEERNRIEKIISGDIDAKNWSRIKFLKKYSSKDDEYLNDGLGVDVLLAENKQVWSYFYIKKLSSRNAEMFLGDDSLESYYENGPYFYIVESETAPIDVEQLDNYFIQSLEDSGLRNFNESRYIDYEIQTLQIDDKDLEEILDLDGADYDRGIDYEIKQTETRIKGAKDLMFDNSGTIISKWHRSDGQSLSSVFEDYKKDSSGLISKYEIDIDINFSGWKYLKGIGADAAKEIFSENSGFSHITLTIEVFEGERPNLEWGDPDSGGYFSPSTLELYLSVDNASFHNPKNIIDDITSDQGVIRHEVDHFAQTALKQIRELGDYAGIPSHRIRHRKDVDSGGTPLDSSQTKWDREPDDSWGRIRHGLRDVEFWPRLNDEVFTFISKITKPSLLPGEPGIPKLLWRDFAKYYTGVDSSIESVEAKDLLDKYRRLTLSREEYNKVVNTRSISRGYWTYSWSKSHWFYFLLQNDKKRWEEAVGKFYSILNEKGVFDQAPNRKIMFPVIEPDHPGWGVAFVRYYQKRKRDFGHLSYNDEVTKEEMEQIIQEHDSFTNSLTREQLKRHKLLVTSTGDREYWVTPRWRNWDPSTELQHHGGNVPEHPNL